MRKLFLILFILSPLFLFSQKRIIFKPIDGWKKYSLKKGKYISIRQTNSDTLLYRWQIISLTDSSITVKGKTAFECKAPRTCEMPIKELHLEYPGASSDDVTVTVALKNIDYASYMKGDKHPALWNGLASGLLLIGSCAVTAAPVVIAFESVRDEKFRGKNGFILAGGGVALFSLGLVCTFASISYHIFPADKYKIYTK